ncbi:NAD(P)/FAD-dependent oxidoreductase [Aspergillus homomorphus CBS 101889]|uniref:FAD/NAD(P)-binding domain-containing protein n=1 Tax=Aspergillus homomorphus (strain CBS 101889) TaxID=1450537 RepID=A0A395I214_ASPHC|nr:FAD/NAD(P)-binding domain-containing protein [Aspergillus homomorphus CBS 101889]RAL14100.1 FAD/NAD(P)-binding domain-containing protein [Aspergillus homomorphus CBS 101889]
MPNPTIIIIGASVAGLPIAHAVLKNNRHKTPKAKAKVILINPSRDFYWMIAAPRILSNPDAFTKAQYLVPIEPGFAIYPREEFEFVHGYAIALDTSAKSVSVSLSNSNTNATTEYTYTHLVIASGSTTPSSIAGSATPTPLYPFKPPPPPPSTNQPEAGVELGELIATAQERIATAKRITIGGAGPIGVETAGELAEIESKPAITLISGTERLLPSLSPGASAAAEAQLLARGVYIVKGVKVVGFTPSSSESESGKDGGGTVTLSDGTTLDTDVYIPTTGVLPNNGFLPAEILDKDGWVRVDDQLRVPGLEGVWAAGDITAHPARLAQSAVAQARVVAGNLVRVINGDEGGKRKVYAPPGTPLMVVPIGNGGGTGQLFFGWVPWAWVVWLAKGRDYFIGKAKSAVLG